MATYHHGILYLSDGWGNPSEVINEARTAYNLRNAGLTEFTNIADNAGCAAYDYEPCSMASDGSVTEWTALNLATNPWGTSATADEAIGFYIEEWTGLDSGHNARAAYEMAGGHGGARFGAQTSKQRVMAMNLVLIGTSERGLNHLFRWLETMFRPTDDGSPMSLWLRETCPSGTTEAALEEGFLRLDDVAMVASPTWIDPPVPDSGCMIRRLSLTLAAGNPCMFAVPSASASSVIATPAFTATTGTAEASCAEWNDVAVRAYVAVTASEVGLTSPIVTVSSPLEIAVAGVDAHGIPLPGEGVRYLVPALRIYGLINDAGLASLDPCFQRRVGTIIIQGLPAGYEITVDCSDGSSFVRDLFGDRNWVDGSQFIGRNSVAAPSYQGKRPVTIPPCTNGFVVVEPAFTGSTHLGTSADIVSTWTVAIQTSVRVGCI